MQEITVLQSKGILDVLRCMLNVSLIKASDIESDLLRHGLHYSKILNAINLFVCNGLF